MAELRIMSPRGDDVVSWTPGNPDEEKKAKQAFDAAIKYRLAYTLEGTEGKQIRAFDPNADTIVLTPPLQGG